MLGQPLQVLSKSWVVPYICWFSENVVTPLENVVIVRKITDVVTKVCEVMVVAPKHLWNKLIKNGGFDYRKQVVLR